MTRLQDLPHPNENCYMLCGHGEGELSQNAPIHK